MSFRRSDLQEAFFVPGTHAFRARLAPRANHQGRPGAARGYGASDPLEAVLAPGYFGAANTLLQPGDLIYVRARASGQGQGGASAAAVHMALLMVRAGPRGSVAVRLVQDFGRSDAPDAVAQTATALPAAVTAAPPAKRGRGRPVGSRSRKNGAMTTMSVN